MAQRNTTAIDGLRLHYRWGITYFRIMPFLGQEIEMEQAIMVLRNCF